MPALLRRHLLAVLACAPLALSPLPASAQDGAPVRLLVGYSAGGPVDQGARLFGQALAKELNTAVIVENKPGANATLAGSEVVRAKPDGLTLWFAASPTITISPNVMAKMPFDPARDLTPVAPILSYYNVLVVNNGEPYKNVQELVAHAKAHPGKLAYGSAGVGGSNHLGALLLARRSGIELNHIPYKGNAPAMTDVIGGQLNMMLDIISTASSYIHAGKVRAIAVTSPRRNPSLPDVPTVAESGIDGLKDFDVGGWYGLYGPRELPPEQVARLNRAANAALAQPELKKRLQDLGYELWTGSPQQLAERAARERTLWSTVTQGIVVN
ncbi:Tripartite-type tricarboxylate transporter, receptor component TctC [Oryzisolibacter propanilivorax]|uniref:Tripartite-type tricarboxylate transporter, receptor component TctC n=1 Tax=Oryzisolibacter propanilivorax TaxID=1527607 RepID=A0A1G9QC72_9BURK|nr:tripartite tricarboxylate transporter substrate binding protein [Oryzisolibacter propanilivorax]SDM08672.1 Tripartite-type tricarboxylate transporter, receptor component TctC [Oryzisolibacter propanilivorax]